VPPPIVNIAAYRFTELTDLPSLRAELKSLCESQDLLGTILLSTEGINLFLAGTREAIDRIVARVRKLPSCASIEVKESLSDTQPFDKLMVKLKREIISMGVPEIAPQKYTSPRLSPEQLKQWLDEGTPVTLLDTRNGYEVDAGTFDGAIAVDIDDFREFPQAIARLPEQVKHQPIVTFCTGGIRCEKAAPLLERAGFTSVYQLDGGILNYFHRVGGSHFHGDCFVFDQRVTVDPQLQPTGSKLCRACNRVSPANQTSCPDCGSELTKEASFGG
jgi:UPF0176 protein